MMHHVKVVLHWFREWCTTLAGEVGQPTAEEAASELRALAELRIAVEQRMMRVIEHAPVATLYLSDFCDAASYDPVLHAAERAIKAHLDASQDSQQREAVQDGGVRG